jgi:hypothetical protein
MSMNEGVHCAGEKVTTRAVDDVPVEELVPCCGECCSIASLFCSFPGCIGCTGQCGLLFCMCKYTCCKLLDCKDADKRCCTLDSCNMYLTYPNKCYECTGQYFCMDMRAAFPCTAKVPCIVNMLGLTCCAGWKCKVACCKKVGDLIPELKEKAGAA